MSFVFCGGDGIIKCMERQQQGTGWKALAAATAAGCAGFAAGLLTCAAVSKRNDVVSNIITFDPVGTSSSLAISAGVSVYNAVHKDKFVDKLEKEREQHEATLSK